MMDQDYIVGAPQCKTITNTGTTLRRHTCFVKRLLQETSLGPKLRLLIVVDEFTRECLVTEVARSRNCRDLRRILKILTLQRGGREMKDTAYERAALR
jgi:hypothetical protein